MKKLSLSFGALSLLALLSAPALAQDLPGLDGVKTLSIDAKKSSIKFVSDAPAEKIVGTAKGLSGDLKLNLDDISKTSGKLMFPVKSMNTGNDLRDEHLHGKDWLNAEAHPNIVFTVKGLEGAKVTDAGKAVSISAVALGTVNVNGVDAPAKAPVEIKILKEAGGDGHTVKVEPTLNVELEKFKIKGKRGTIGSKVAKSVAITGTVYGTAK